MNCPPEDNQNDPYSSGPIRDQEMICRGAFTPRHTNKPGTILKINRAIRSSDLQECELSVWREGEERGASEIEILTELGIAAKRGGQAVFAILRATAEEIRSITGPPDSEIEKCFCIVDDCVCDPHTKRKHVAHANMGYSVELLELVGEEKDNPAEQFALNKLKLLLDNNVQHLDQP